MEADKSDDPFVRGGLILGELLPEQIQAAQELLDRGFVPSELLESGKAVLAGVER